MQAVKKKDEDKSEPYVEQIPLKPVVYDYNDGVDESYIYRLRKRIIKISENKEKNQKTKKKPKRLMLDTKGKTKTPALSPSST